MHKTIKPCKKLKPPAVDKYKKSPKWFDPIVFCLPRISKLDFVLTSLPLKKIKFL